MKNLKNMVSATGLMAVLVFGAVSVNAQSSKGDRTKNPTEVQCTVKSEGFFQGLRGIINKLTGITFFDVTRTNCSEVISNRVRWS